MGASITIDIDKSFLPINSFAVGENTSFLMQNKYVAGWGRYQFMTNAKKDLVLTLVYPGTISKITLPEKADKIYTIGSYTAVLTQKGRVLFWGKCSSQSGKIIN